MKIPGKIIIFLFIFAIPASCFCSEDNYQKSQSYTFLKQEIIRTAENLLLTINNEESGIKGSELLVQQVLESIKKRSGKEYKKIIKQAELKDLESSSGLAFESGAGYQDSLDSENETDAYIGLTWDFLRNGKREFSAKEKKLKAELKKLNIEEKTEFNSYADKYAAEILDGFASLSKVESLEIMLRINNFYYSILRDSYFLGNTLLDDVLEVKNMDKKITNKIKFLNQNIRLYKGNLKSFHDYEIPGDLRIEEILNKERKMFFQAGIDELDRTIIKNSHIASDDKRLYIYARTGASADKNGSSAGDISAGVKFRVPFGVSKKHRLEKELDMVTSRNCDLWNIHRSELIHLYKLYLNEIRKAEQKWNQHIITSEKLRISLMKLKYKGGIDYLTEVIKRCLELAEQKNDIIENKKMLYKKLVSFFGSSMTQCSSKYIKDFNAKSEFERLRPYERSVYIWSESLMKYSNNYIIDSLKSKKIKTVAVSAGFKTDIQKLENLVILADKNDIETEVLIGNNQVLLNKDISGFIEKIKDMIKISGSIHLDIEPHAINSDKFSESELWERYYKILKTICSIKTQDEKISISLPFHIPVIHLKKIAELADKIYVMAYGKSSARVTKKRLYPFLEYYFHKTVIAVRASDFNSELELEDYLDIIHKETDVKSFAIHDIKSFYKIAGDPAP